MAIWFYILKARILHWRIPFGIQKSRARDEESFPLFISYSCWLTNSEVKWEVGTWGWILGVDSADSGKGKDDGDSSMAGAWQTSAAMILDWSSLVGGRGFVCKVQLEVVESFHIRPKEMPKACLIIQLCIPNALYPKWPGRGPITLRNLCCF